MNSILPAAIETYLKEADFSSTEMLILRKLLEEDALTLRELASKTGKSTGVLDIAMKKLLRKGIAERTVINGTMRYCIESLDSVASWVKHDMEERQKDMKRKHESFEYFIASLKVDKKRPDMEHFTGEEGLKQAYLRLIEGGQELLTLTPILYRAEDDPLREFKVELFKRRQSRKIFQRIITSDSPVARRYQSRDMFEYRRTSLLPSQDFGITFERTVVGNTVGCFNVQEQTACLLRYPELADAERATFENLWAHAVAHEKGEGSLSASVQAPIKSVVPLSTRLASAFRQFFLSKYSMLLLAICGLVALGVAAGLTRQAENISLQRLQDHLKATAAIGALQIDARDVQAVWGAEDITTEAYARLVASLNTIRRSDPSIRYAYIMRKTDDPNMLAFVADADSLVPSVPLDLNDNRVIGREDELSYPGDPYDISEQQYALEAFMRPMADPTPVTDQWGTLIAGMAPIVNTQGETIATLGVDILSEKLKELSPSISSVFLVFGIVFLLISTVRFMFIHKELLLDVWAAFLRHKRITLLWLTFITLVIVGATLTWQHYAEKRELEEIGKRLMAIAATAASEFDPEDLDQLHWARDMKTEAYQRVFRKLNAIRNANPEVTYAYIMRATEEESTLMFVADADANWNLPIYAKPFGDFSDFDESDEGAASGVMYYQNTMRVMSNGLVSANYGYGELDQWGNLVTAAAPIQIGRYVLGVDVDVDYFK
ncbi:MAG: hypothetical protein ABL890_00990 [Candidatus Peribacteraceae bacterium]